MKSINKGVGVQPMHVLNDGLWATLKDLDYDEF